MANFGHFCPFMHIFMQHFSALLPFRTCANPARAHGAHFPGILPSCSPQLCVARASSHIARVATGSCDGAAGAAVHKSWPSAPARNLARVERHGAQRHRAFVPKDRQDAVVAVSDDGRSIDLPSMPPRSCATRHTMRHSDGAWFGPARAR
jgi:hypothetical protein